MRRLDIVEMTAQRLETLEVDDAQRTLTRRVRSHSPIAVELLAYEHLRSPIYEAHRVAAVEVRVLRGFASELRFLAELSERASLSPSLRAAVGHLLAELTDFTDFTGDTEDTGLDELLESALLYHALFAKLRPWLPPIARPFEIAETLDMLTLALSPERQLELRPRFEALWAMFHRVSQLPSTKLALLDGPTPDRLARTIQELALERAEIPAAPPWPTPSWAAPWSTGGSAPLPDSRSAPGGALASNSPPPEAPVELDYDSLVEFSRDCG